MNKEDVVNTPCPPKEELSAWHDREGTEEVGRHVETCEGCQKVTRFYGRVDGAISAQLQPGPDLVKKIVCQCSRTTPAQPLPFPSLLMVLRVAAVVAVVAAIASTLAVLGPLRPRSGPEMIANNALPAPSSPTAPVVPLGGNGSVHGTHVIPVMTTTPLNNATVKPASVSGGMDRQDLANLLNIFTTPKVLPDSVRHVWVVNNVSTSLQKFLAALPAGARPVCVQRGDTSVCYQVPLTDGQLQGLVDKLQNDGWALVTPNLPQPGQTDKFRAIGKEILYVVDLVTR